MARTRGGGYGSRVQSSAQLVSKLVRLTRKRLPSQQWNQHCCGNIEQQQLKMAPRSSHMPAASAPTLSSPSIQTLTDNGDHEDPTLESEGEEYEAAATSKRSAEKITRETAKPSGHPASSTSASAGHSSSCTSAAQQGGNAYSCITAAATGVASKRAFKNGQGSKSETLRQAVEVLKQVSNNVTSNEFMVFGQQIGIQLTKLPLKKALEVQLEIQSLLTAARLRELRAPSPPSPAPSTSSFLSA